MRLSEFSALYSKRRRIRTSKLMSEYNKNKLHTCPSLPFAAFWIYCHSFHVSPLCRTFFDATQHLQFMTATTYQIQHLQWSVGTGLGWEGTYFAVFLIVVCALHLVQCIHTHEPRAAAEAEGSRSSTAATRGRFVFIATRFRCDAFSSLARSSLWGSKLLGSRIEAALEDFIKYLLTWVIVVLNVLMEWTNVRISASVCDFNS